MQLLGVCYVGVGRDIATESFQQSNQVCIIRLSVNETVSRQEKKGWTTPGPHVDGGLFLLHRRSHLSAYFITQSSMSQILAHPTQTETTVISKITR